MLTILVPGSFQMLMLLKVYYVPGSFADFVIHVVDSFGSLTNFMWSIVPMSSLLDQFFLE